ncbi:MAG: F0F1 ATP synthase subunit delta [Candidatus Omnitrophica bacterium]|nr:F0F1 ATP synthase subunit delta [Candidatus Omnitrophota bacterium]
MSFPIMVQFVILQLLVFLGIIFILYRVFVSQVDGAKQRLERDAEAARAKEAELNRKIRQADEELTARKKELDNLERKMKGDLEAEAIKHREDLIQKARTEAEEIIIKAQNAAEGIRRDVEKQLELKVVDHTTKVIDEVLSKKAKSALEKDLVDEFIIQLANVDMSKISMEIKAADVVTTQGLGEADLRRISEIVRAKTGRDIALHPKTEGGHISGVVLQFGSLHLDGSLKSAIREAAASLKAEIEKGNLKK